MYPTLSAVEEALRTLLASLDPAVVHGPDAVVALERFSTIEKMAATGRMLMGKRVAETNAWRASGAATAEHFLAKVAGCSLAEAHRLLGTAEKLAKLPDTDRAARAGDLSTGQAGDIADAATADPAAERDLLDLASQASAAELRDEARKRRHAAEADDARRHRRIRAARSLRAWTGHDGAAHLHWNHLPEAGAEVGAILDDYIDEQFHHARRAGHRERREAYAADAFVEALRDAAAYRRGESINDESEPDETEPDQNEPDGTEPDEAEPVGAETEAGRTGADEADEADDVEVIPDGPDVARDERRSGAGRDARAPGDAGLPGPHPASDDRRGGSPPGTAEDDVAGRGERSPQPPTAGRGPVGSPRRRGRRRSGRRRGADAKVIVVIDHAALVRGHTEAGETCTIAGIGAVPVASVRELLDDAFLAAVVKQGVDVHTVAHLGRRPNAYQETALQAQGIECSTLGCPNRHHLERDHRTPYRVTRHTTLRELDYSCPACHDRKTYEGAMLAPGTGKRRLLTVAEQVQWNLDHPDNPVQPPQTAYPNRPRTTGTRSTPRSRPPPTTTGDPVVQELPLDG